MKRTSLRKLPQGVSRDLFSTLAVLVLALALSGCLAVGYSSGGGWFVWPGGLGLAVLILLVLFFLRRRR